MKFNISKESLVAALNTVLKGTSARATLPILSGILLDADSSGSVVFQTTDLEISIKHTVQADVIEMGKAVVPGKLFSDIVKNLPDAAVGITSSQEQTEIRCMDSSFTLSSLNPADFPYFPEVIASQIIELPSAELGNVVKKIAKAVSRDESRAVLTGVLFSVEAGNVYFAATDSYRLCVSSMQQSGFDGDDFQVIIPGKTFEDVTRLASDFETIKIGFSDNQVIFQFGTTIFVSRKIEGNYPNYKQLIPNDHAVSIELDTQTLITAIKRVSLLAQSHTPVHFVFEADEQKVKISARTQDVGTASETIDAKIDGEDIEIAFNHQYLLDGLSSLSGQTIIELQSSLKPGIIKDSENPGFLYLAMPVRLN